MEGPGRVLILLGPPGVGKGTQGTLLVDWLGWERLATGDILRAARAAESELGLRAQRFMDAGDLVPDELIVDMVKERVEGLSVGQGIIFDGFPRTVAQAEALEQVLAEGGRSVDAVMLLEAPDDVLVKRIAGRRSCPECNRVYNVHFDPPLSVGVCDACGGPLDHRMDDTPETVRHRLSVYRDQTQPLVAHYDRGPVTMLRIDGAGSLEEVRGEARRVLTQHLQVEA